MLVYRDLICGDELLSDSFQVEETHNGIFYEVPGKWVNKGPVDVDIGANPSEEDPDAEGVDDSVQKVVDVIDTFRLQEQPAYDKKGFMGYIKGYIQKLSSKLPADQQEEFKANVQPAVKWLIGKLSDLQFFLGESMDLEGGMVFAYYKEGATEPTFVYFKHGLKEEKC